MDNKNLTAGTKSSIVVNKCQTCGNSSLETIIFLGYLPPVNTMHSLGNIPREEPSYPAQLLFCKKCKLAQLGLIVDPHILFPKEYPYTSGTTKMLRDNFEDLYAESTKLINLKPNDLVIDIGSNDGTLLNNFKAHKILGITPEDIGKIAIKNGIPTILSYFTDAVTKKVLNKYGKAKIITAANVFAHIENVHAVIKNILKLLNEDGVFISESHFLFSLLKMTQYDTIYHEHLRYYSLHSLRYLLSMHGLEIFHAKKIPSHGGSIRVYAARKNTYPIKNTVKKLLAEEKNTVTSKKSFNQFKKNVVFSKLKLYNLLFNIKRKNQLIYGISAPSRATTLISYVGIDEEIINCVLEIKGSHKIGKYIPGTLIPVFEESKLYKDQPDYAILFSWHIAKELMPKLVKNGFRGDFIIPLPIPHIVKGETIAASNSKNK